MVRGCPLVDFVGELMLAHGGKCLDLSLLVIKGVKRFVLFVDIVDRDCYIAHLGWVMLVREE